MDDILYGCRLLRVAPLEADGSVPTTPQWVSADTPQSAQVAPVVSAGQSTEQRGGDRLLAVIQEDDEYIGADITFTDAKLSGPFMEIVTGGTYTPGPPEAFDLPALGSPRQHFTAELYVANYAEGTQHQSDVTGYTKFIFYNCSGSIPQLNTQDRSFVAPQFTLRARDNKASGKRFMRWEIVTSLPA